MAQVEFTGQKMTATAGIITLEGVTRIVINDVGAPVPEAFDVTVVADGTYTFLEDPLGGKGAPKATVTVTCQASTASLADGKAASVAFNTPAAFLVESGQTPTDNTWAHTTTELVKRVTKITWGAPVATVELTFQANTCGTWGTHA